MEKLINQPLSLGGAICEEPICGGVQGENRATAIEFIPDEELSLKLNEYKSGGYSVTFKIDAVTAAGELVGSEERSGEEIFSPFYLTQRITASGLDCVVVARIFVSREEAKELCKAQIKLCFIPSPVALNSDISNRDEANRLERLADDLIEAFTETTEQAEKRIDKKVTLAKNSAESVARHLKQVQQIAEANEQTIIELEEGTTFVFLGGDANHGIDADIIVEDTLSEESKNAVENGVITREINLVKESLNEQISASNQDLTQQIGSAEEQLRGEIGLAKQELSGEIGSLKDSLPQEFVVEQGITEDGWCYRKWNSGVAECWARFEGEVAVNTLWPNQEVLYYGLIGGFNYPITFVENPVVSVDLDAQDSWCNKYPSTTTETGNIYAVGAVNKTEQYTLNIIAKGRWK